MQSYRSFVGMGYRWVNVAVEVRGPRRAATPSLSRRYLAEGEAAVIRPLRHDFEIVARVKHDAWRALVR